MPFDPNRRANVVGAEALGEPVQVAGTPKRVTIDPNVVPWDGPRRTVEESETWMQVECLHFALQKQKEFCELVEFKKRNVLAQVWTSQQEEAYQQRRLQTAEFFDRFLRTEESDGLFYKRVIRPMQSEPYSPTWRREQFDRLFEKHSLAKNELNLSGDLKEGN